MARRGLLLRNSTTPQEPAINITPLVDVVFVILIAFMVIAPLLELDRIELASGDAAPSHLPVRFDDASAIQIYVHEDNQIVFNEQPIELHELCRLVRAERARFPQARVQLFHHKKAHFGTYQSVKNALETAGCTEMDVVLLPS